MTSNKTDQFLLIHFWSPDMFGFKGGIQLASLNLLNGLETIAPHASIQVYLLHDLKFFY